MTMKQLVRASSSPHDAGVGRGLRRGGIERAKRASSPQPSPPSADGEGVISVAALPRSLSLSAIDGLAYAD